MTDAAEPVPETTEASPWGDWDGSAGDTVAGGTTPAATVPQRADHKFTLGLRPGSPPTLTIRAETALDLGRALSELEMAGTWALIGGHVATAQAQGQVGNQLGAVPAAVQPPQQGYTPPVQPQQPPMGAQPQWGPPIGAGGQPGTAPAAWQNAGAPPVQQGWGQQAPAAAPPGWYAVVIPYQSKAAGDAIKEQLKAQGLYQGNMKWDGNSTPKRWLVSPAVVGAFAAFSPTPV
jgi:hypothetical protein